MKRLIDEEDAIRAICKNCYAEDGGDYKDCRYYKDPAKRKERLINYKDHKKRKEP